MLLELLALSFLWQLQSAKGNIPMARIGFRGSYTPIVSILAFVCMCLNFANNIPGGIPQPYTKRYTRKLIWKYMYIETRVSSLHR